MSPGTGYTPDPTDEEVDAAVEEALRDVEASIARFRASGGRADGVVFGLLFRDLGGGADLIGAGACEHIVDLLEAANQNEIEGTELPPLEGS